MPALKPACQGRHRAGRGEGEGESGEGGGPEAGEREEGHGLGALGQAAEVVDALVGVVGGGEPALGGDGREGEEGRAGADEGRDQDRGRQRVGCGRGEGEAEGDQGVEQEVERDVDEGAAVGRAGLARHGTVEAVGQAVEGDECCGGAIGAEGQGRHREKAHAETGKGDLVGGDAVADQPAGWRGHEAALGGQKPGVDHERLHAWNRARRRSASGFTCALRHSPAAYLLASASVG